MLRAFFVRDILVVQWFSRLSRKISFLAGTWQAFTAATLGILFWGISGPFFNYSDTWQLYANTGTTLITFVMVFLIQGSQNHDTSAIQAKLDELIRANARARNKMICLEDLTSEEISEVRAQLSRLADKESCQ